jgi:hypothetical protein
VTWNQAQARAKELRAQHPDAHPARTVSYGWCVQWRRKTDNGHDWTLPHAEAQRPAVGGAPCE